MKLQAHKRDGKVSDASMVPGVCYGPETESISFAIDRALMEKTYRDLGMATIIELDIEGESHDVLIKEIQRHPVRENILHVDMYAIKRGVEMEIAVPLEFLNEEDTPALKAGGVLVKVLHEVEVKCKPRHIPSHLDVDLAKIKEIGQSLHLSDIELGEGVAFVSEDDEVVATVTEVRADAGEGEDGPDLQDPAAEPVLEGDDGDNKNIAAEKEVGNA